MPEGLMTPDGAAVAVPPVDPGFSELMAGAAAAADEGKEAPAPPKKDPEAPFGRTQDGKPKKGPGGRPPKRAAEKPRVTSKAAVAPDETKDYRPGLDEFFTGVWGVACLGNQADAGAILVAKQALVNNWHAAAQQSPKIGRLIDTVTGSTAVGMAIGATVLLGLQIAANHGRVDARAVAHLGIRSREELEQVNLQAMQQMAEEMQAAQVAAQAAA